MAGAPAATCPRCSPGPQVVARSRAGHERRDRRPHRGPRDERRRRGRLARARAGLSPREAEIIALITQGLSNQEIADRAYLSINSVKTYIRSAYRKMDVTTRSQAVLWGVENGFKPDTLRTIDPVPADASSAGRVSASHVLAGQTGPVGRRRQPHPERAALARLRAHLERAAVAFDDVVGDRQAQAAPGDGGLLGQGGPEEPVESRLLLVCGTPRCRCRPPRVPRCRRGRSARRRRARPVGGEASARCRSG